MITGELKNRIDSLWDIFAAGGLVNPLDVIEQITYRQNQRKCTYCIKKYRSGFSRSGFFNHIEKSL